MIPQTLDQILEGRRSQPHQLIEVLQDVQKNYGYISKETMQTVSQYLGVPIMEVYRVASFYKAFRLNPSGKNVITMCMGTACHVRGARLLLIVLVLMGLCVNTAAALSGSGTQQDPWRIESPADLNEFAADANYWDDYTHLETDVNLARLTYTTAVIAPDINNTNTPATILIKTST